MKKIYLSIILVAILCSNLYSQSTHVSGLFPTIDHSGRISQHFDYSLYYFGAFPLINFQASNENKASQFLLLYLEQAVTYNVNDHLSFTGSYVYQRENVNKSNYINENRIHIQAAYKHELNKVKLKHRLRLDNRFIQNRVTGESPYTHRLRYFLGLELPISAQKSNLYFTAYEELFFNTFRGASSIYAENWAYAALGIKANKRNKFEFGPLYITWNTGGSNWFNQYYFQFTWLSKLDL